MSACGDEKAIKDLSVVIPVYRCAAMVGPLAQRLIPVLDSLEVDYEIIFVDDGSDDASWEALSAIRAKSPARVTAIQLAKNVGQHTATLCGLRHARGKAVATMDADLQHPPEELPKLLQALTRENVDAVYGRYRAKRHSAWRNAASRMVIYAFRKLFRTSVRPTSFRVLRRPLVDAICRSPAAAPLIDGIMAFHTQRVAHVEVEHAPRPEGRSAYSLARLVKLAITLFFGYTMLFPRLVTGLALLSLATSAVVGFVWDIRPGPRVLLAFQLVVGGLVLIQIAIGLLQIAYQRNPLLGGMVYLERNVLSPAEFEEPRVRQARDGAKVRQRAVSERVEEGA